MSKQAWFVKGGVGGHMWLRPGRGNDGSPRWAIRRSDGRRFATLLEAEMATVWAGGHVEPV